MKKDASRFSPKGVLFHRTFFTAPSFDYAVVDDCPDVKKGSHKQRNQLNRLKARKKAGSHLRSARCH